tara:strand:- start:30 stop:158 length:129 start_codon:yes stop_codon:yes gene_type:complete
MEKCDYCEGKGKYSLESIYQREENMIECNKCMGSGNQLMGDE